TAAARAAATLPTPETVASARIRPVRPHSMSKISRPWRVRVATERSRKDPSSPGSAHTMPNAALAWLSTWVLMRRSLAFGRTASTVHGPEKVPYPHAQVGHRLLPLGSGCAGLRDRLGPTPRARAGQRRTGRGDRAGHVH